MKTCQVDQCALYVAVILTLSCTSCDNYDIAPTAEQIAEILEESLDTIQPIYDIALRQAPDYNTDKVFEELNSNK